MHVGILAFSRPEPTRALMSTNDRLISEADEAPGEAPATRSRFPPAARLPVCNMNTQQTWQQPSTISDTLQPLPASHGPSALPVSVDGAKLPESSSSLELTVWFALTTHGVKT